MQSWIHQELLMLLEIWALEMQFRLTPSVTNALARDHGRVLQHILVSVAMCRNPACPHFFLESAKTAYFQDSMRSSHFKIFSTVSAWPTRISLKARLLAQENAKRLQPILLGSGERLYAEWLFARDSHHLSHRISSAISQSLHACRSIRKHCMCRNLHESFIIFIICHINNLSRFLQFRPVQFKPGQNLSCLFRCVACIVEIFCDNLSHCTIRLWVVIMSYYVCRNESFDPCNLLQRKSH